MTVESREPTIRSERLVLRPWRPEEAVLMHELWRQRDPRVPAHRRIDAEGHPTVEEIRQQISGATSNPLGPLVVEEVLTGEGVGYCGLIASERTPGGEPELAFEFLTRVWGRGYATEAGQAVIDWAEGHGYSALGATVWDWNTASRRVLRKLGFFETAQVWTNPAQATTLLAMLDLRGRQ